MALQSHQRSDGEQPLRVRVTPRPMADSPASPMLSSNFIELGYGYQVEAMWSEMLFNRSFEKWVPIFENTRRWLGVGLDGDWSGYSWHHSGYEHHAWQPLPGPEGPTHIRDGETFIVERSPESAIEIRQVEGGAHGAHCLEIANRDPARWAGMGQYGLILEPNETYRFRGRLKSLRDAPAEAELRIYAQGEWSAPVAAAALGPIGVEDAERKAEFSSGAFGGRAVFALWLSPGAIVQADAFSLMPAKTIHGWKPEVVDILKRINPGLIRFPGGCFASFHNWKTAIGPFDQRVPEPSYFWGDLNYNDVGTMEFLQLCEAVGCEAMLCANVFHPKKTGYLRQRNGFDTPGFDDPDQGVRLAADWVAYCNAPQSHPQGRLRAEHGHPEPFGVKYWELDNEGFRWMEPEEYARECVRYSQAMKAVDPSILVGMTSYGNFAKAIPEMLAIAGGRVDFLADRVCEPENIAAKMAAVRQWNAAHPKQPIFYADTEALQYRDGMLDPYTAERYRNAAMGAPEKRRTWANAMTLASSLMALQRYGGDARFLCFNNLANTAGQSCVSVSKDAVCLEATGYVMELLSRTEAAWPLVLEGRQADQRQTVQIQAAWSLDKTKLVVHLLNRGPDDRTATLDLGALGTRFASASIVRLSAADALTEETMSRQGNIRREEQTQSISSETVEFAMPRFSFAEATLR